MVSHRFSLPLIALTFLLASLSAQTPRSLLPVVPGWRLTIDGTIYKPDNLWDLIDGAADLYLEYNFVELRLGRYLNADSVEIKVEPYRHASAADAFGIYSQERYPDYHFLDIGVQGYREKGVLNFLAGPYYVKISSVQAGDKVQDGLLLIAKAVESHLGQPKTWPARLAAFPKHGRVENADQYIAKSFLGYSFLNGAYVATYEDQGSFKCFIMELANADQVREVRGTYLAEIQKDGVNRLPNGWLKVNDPHSGAIELGWKDGYLFGIYGDEKASNRTKFLQQLAASLSTAH